eukprot:scaffold92980_cov42-Attheya_sp.AAC.3
MYWSYMIRAKISRVKKFQPSKRTHACEKPNTTMAGGNMMCASLQYRLAYLHLWQCIMTGDMTR